MIEGFVKGWIKQFSVLPKKQAVGVIWSQNALETGATNSMWNNNIGNVKFVASADPAADEGKQYMMLNNVWEIKNGQKEIYQPPHPATWFRAFPTLADGVAFHLDFLRNKRYKTSWDAVEAGDPSQFAHLLKIHGYYTDTEENYARNMNYYFKKFMADPTFENVIAALQPKLEINPTTGEVTVIGELDLVPKPPSGILGAISNFFNKK